jgi:hypothetical protein
MIKKAIKKLAETDAPMARARVLAVDKNACTCAVQMISDDGTLEDVKLKPIVNAGDPTQLGLVFFPALNSIVTVGQVNGDNIDNVIIGYTVIESISLDTATAIKLLLDSAGNLNLNAGNITVNNGLNGGIPMATPLSAIIMKLQNQVNQLITIFNTHIHPVAGAATGITATPGPAVTAQIIKPADIANPKFKQ